MDSLWFVFFIRWLHVLSGVMWVGLLWYFNFVQVPSVGKMPDELKPAVSKFIAPSALFWFRWAALSTLFWGLFLAGLNGYSMEALAIGLIDGEKKHAMIGVGMWLGIIMAFNVWFLIWPNQQRVLGLVEATPDEKKASARRALLASRANLALSLPMLYAMVAAQNPY